MNLIAAVHTGLSLRLYDRLNCMWGGWQHVLIQREEQATASAASPGTRVRRAALEPHSAQLEPQACTEEGPSSRQRSRGGGSKRAQGMLVPVPFCASRRVEHAPSNMSTAFDAGCGKAHRTPKRRT